MADGLTEAVTSVHDPEDGPYYYYLAYLAYLDAFLKPGQRRKAGNPIGSPAFVVGLPSPHSLWAKGDLNPHVPKDTGT